MGGDGRLPATGKLPVKALNLQEMGLAQDEGPAEPQPQADIPGFVDQVPSAPNPQQALNPLFRGEEAKEPSPADLEKAKKFFEQGNRFFQKEKYKKALESFVKASEANPQDPDILFLLGQAAQASGELPRAHDAYSFLLQLEPEHQELRALRLEVDQVLLQGIASNLNKIHGKQRDQLGQMMMGLMMETRLDQAHLLAIDADKVMERLKNSEKELGGLHSATQDKKAKAIGQIETLAQEATKLMALPFSDPKEQEAVVPKISAIAAMAYGILASFTKVDPDVSFQRYQRAFEVSSKMASGDLVGALPLYQEIGREGYKDLGKGDAKAGREKMEAIAKQADALIQGGKQEEAQKLVSDLAPGLMEAHQFLDRVAQAEMIRSEGFKRLGNGNEAEGKKQFSVLLEKARQLKEEANKFYGEAQQLAKEGKRGFVPMKLKNAQVRAQEVEKIAAALQEGGLMEACQFLAPIDAAKMQNLNRKAMEVWKAYIQDIKNKELAAAQDHWFLGSIGAFFRATPWLGDGKTRYDDATDKFLINDDLRRAVESQISSGKAASLGEALERVKEYGEERLRPLAAELLTKREEGFKLLDVLEYAASPNSELEKVKVLSEQLVELIKDSTMHHTADALTALMTGEGPEGPAGT